ncbi:MAG: RHS repeat-associated core domain-containing protein [Enterobacterales bacterium]|nr:RHS repeat-associated core domain-containing protein [Enterobacterales bacterium]
MVFGNHSAVFDVVSSMYVVASVTSQSAGLPTSGDVNAGSYLLSQQQQVKYRYRGARMQSGGRGFLGFEALSTLDPQTGVETTTSYLQQFPFTGRPLSTVRRLLGSNDLWGDSVSSCSDCVPGSFIGSGSGGGFGGGSGVISENWALDLLMNIAPSGTTLPPTEFQKTASSSNSTVIELSRATNTWESFGTVISNPGVVFPFLAESVEINRLLDQNLPETLPLDYSPYSHAVSTRVTTANVYDEWANPTLITVTTQDKNGIQLQQKVTQSVFDSRPIYQRFGRLTASTVTSYSTSGSTGIVKQSAFEYDPISLLLKKEIIAPNGGLDETLITAYKHDSSGNIIKKTTCSAQVANCGDSTSQNASNPLFINRWVTSEYDLSQTFANVSRNTLGHAVSQVLQRNLSGQPTESVDIYGTHSYQEYDPFGMVIHGWNDTGAESWTGKQAFAGDFGITTQVTQVTLGAPTKVEYSDALGRSIRKGIQGFDGIYIYTDTLSDTQGRVRLKSQPYKSDNSIRYWHQSTYDLLGRVIKTVSADGNTYSEIQNNGLTTLSRIGIADYEVNGGNGLVKTEIKDPLGQLIKIIDHLGGSIDYVYDGHGKLRFMHSHNAAGTQTITTEIQYDPFGRKLKTIDPDMGTWRYQYNALGEVVSQTDAKLQVVENRYDPLGRLVQRFDRNASGTLVGQAIWQYDPLLGHLITAYDSLDGNYNESYSYDSFGRVDSKTTQVDGKNYIQKTWYDSMGRVVSTQSRLWSLAQIGVIDNEYNAYGYLYKRIDRDSGQVLWQALASDNYGHITHAANNNGSYETTDFYTPETGLINQQIMQKVDQLAIQDLSYHWDTLGNLRLRRDNKTGREETFDYDNLNRLKQSQIGAQIKTFAYDDFGNIQIKDGVNYQYGTTGAGPHALSQRGASSYYYDTNGNMTSGGGRSLVYSTFNKPTQVAKGSSQVIFNYNINRSRYKRINRSNNRLVDTKITAGGVEVVFKGSSTEVRRYVGNALMKYTYNGTSVIPTKSIDYLYKDHLGSMDTIVSASSNSAPMKMSFDSFGNRRLTSWVNSLPTTSGVLDLLAMTDKGYTGHETLDDVGLIHMNGRVYDPTLGRFLSADPNIQAPTDTQSLNRYSYVLNNPLSATDPSGYFFSKLKKYWRTIASIVITIYFPMIGWVGDLGAIGSGALTGFLAGAVATGSWRGALVGAFTGALFGGIHDGVTAGMGKVLAHGLAGGVSSVLNGGKFGHGFMSAGITQFAGYKGWMPKIGANNLGQRIKNAVSAAVLGGTVSRLTGGKFASGAITGAFSRLLNDMAANKLEDKVNKWAKKINLAKKYGKKAIKLYLAVDKINEAIAIATKNKALYHAIQVMSKEQLILLWPPVAAMDSRSVEAMRHMVVIYVSSNSENNRYRLMSRAGVTALEGVGIGATTLLPSPPFIGKLSLLFELTSVNYEFTLDQQREE